ncbi:MAG TPA: SDR family NAD(P)-dependent oxidoreductase [Vicinamibacterales bacterium]
MTFRDRVVWLTGASSGIGEALTPLLASRGARVAISARRGDRLEMIAAAARAHGGDVRAFPLDVTDRQATRETVAAIERTFGPVDVAILNAGSHLRPAARPFDAQQYLDTFALNVFGAIHGIEAVLPGMLARRRGWIVGISSLAGYRAVPTAGAYGSSKAALSHILDALRFDLEEYGVRVINVTPGFIKTPLTDRNRFRMPFLMPVDAAARRIVEGIERERREIHFPKPFSWTLKLLRVLPYPLYDLIIRRATADRQRLQKLEHPRPGV